jgi:hypothetical protein
VTLFGRLTPDERLTLEHAARSATPKPCDPLALPPARLDDERMQDLLILAKIEAIRDWIRLTAFWDELDQCPVTTSAADIRSQIGGVGFRPTPRKCRRRPAECPTLPPARPWRTRQFKAGSADIVRSKRVSLPGSVADVIIVFARR